MKEKDNIAVYLQILTVKHLSEVVDIRYKKFEVLGDLDQSG